MRQNDTLYMPFSTIYGGNHSLQDTVGNFHVSFVTCGGLIDYGSDNPSKRCVLLQLFALYKDNKE